MQKIYRVKLNNFYQIPSSLRLAGTINRPKEQTSIDLANLFQQYYMDKYGRYIPDPNPAEFEYSSFITNTSDFRIKGQGLGVSTVARRQSSTDLGQAFCRQFLYEHLNITYFAHMEHVINQSTIRAFNGIKIERTQNGDVPDYFCAESVDRVYIAEAKGRYSSINFTTREFENWRNQFARIVVKDRNEKTLRIKGYIVGTRLATEDNQRIQSTVYAEDPQTIGEFEFNGREYPDLGSRIISIHYSDIAEKINQPLLASSLLYGHTIQNELGFPAVVWELIYGPLKGMRFVGGYYVKGDNYNSAGKLINDPLNLLSPRITFFGVEERIFRRLVDISRGRMINGIEMPKIDHIEPFYSGVSILRDGSILAPYEFLKPVEQITDI